MNEIKDYTVTIRPDDTGGWFSTVTGPGGRVIHRYLYRATLWGSRRAARREIRRHLRRSRRTTRRFTGEDV